MLAELAAFNAGFAVVKQVVANGRDLSDAMGAIGKMVGAKEDLKRRGDKKKNSLFSALGGKTEDDFEEFMALEKIKTIENELISKCACTVGPDCMTTGFVFKPKLVRSVDKKLWKLKLVKLETWNI